LISNQERKEEGGDEGEIKRDEEESSGPRFGFKKSSISLDAVLKSRSLLAPLK